MVAKKAVKKVVSNSADKRLKEAEAALYDAQRRTIEANEASVVMEGEYSSRVMLQKLSYDFTEGYFELDEEVSGHTVSQLLSHLRIFSRMYPKRNITLEMNSPGGSIIDGFRLYDELLRFREEGHHLTIRVRGMAASMAGVILQAADHREIGPSAFVMIHRAGFGAAGKAYEIEDEVEFVKMLESRIVDIFSDRSGKKRSTFTNLFTQRKDIWLDSAKSLSMGLVDGIA